MSRLTAKQCLPVSQASEIGRNPILQHGWTSVSVNQTTLKRWNTVFLGPSPTGRESLRSWMNALRKKRRNRDIELWANWSERTQRPNGHALNRQVWQWKSETRKWVIPVTLVRGWKTSWRMEPLLLAQPCWAPWYGDGATVILCDLSRE